MICQYLRCSFSKILIALSFSPRTFSTFLVVITRALSLLIRSLSYNSTISFLNSNLCKMALSYSCLAFSICCSDSSYFSSLSRIFSLHVLMQLFTLMNCPSTSLFSLSALSFSCNAAANPGVFSIFVNSAFLFWTSVFFSSIRF